MRTFATVLTIVFCFLSCQTDDQRDKQEDIDLIQKDSLINGLLVDSLNLAISNASKLPNFYGLMVTKDDEVIFERYFKGTDQNTKFHLRSVTKNITSALSGIAIEERILDSLDSTVKDDYPNLIQGEKEQITIRHLLNMSSGLTWDEDQEIIDLLEFRIQNPIDELLNRELASQPGNAFNYNSVSPHIVSDIISKRTGTSFEDFALEYLFEDLGIVDFEWLIDPQSRVWGGLGLQLKMRDMSKFGQLYLNRGLWENKQLVPEEWVDLSSIGQIEIPGFSTSYSLQWYVSENLDRKVYFGQGFGGQALMLIPSENMQIIAFQEYLVDFAQSNQQWRNFMDEVFPHIYRSIQ